ncbi:hypothetical protein PpBr36_01451 [Pyricularia pennisetigena]|uniref:hypothetical protein n=1 Tax=Pyricularia pennisetigena TaxID=1578925 RepID=UPI001154142A|nr:hypothetical protein PpBr36_01451 [Pyricularia pennisetigena]TLS29709.1 hypothetical protein PpBr36_01451 [Pyricularia pennisetigena]
MYLSGRYCFSFRGLDSTERVLSLDWRLRLVEASLPTYLGKLFPRRRHLRVEDKPWQPWLKLLATTKRFGGQDDTRVFFKVDWDAVPSNVTSTAVYINITTICGGIDKYGDVQVPISKRSVPGNYSEGFIEADGMVSIEGEHYQRFINASPPSNTTASLSYHTFKN